MKSRLAYRLRIVRYDARKRLDRLARGLRYAIGRATKADAETMLYECSHIAGDYCLESFSVGDVIENALEEYEDTPALREVCENAAARVWQKWNSTGDARSAACDWAHDLVREWAAERGLSGLPTDEESAAIAQARA